VVEEVDKVGSRKEVNEAPGTQGRAKVVKIEKGTLKDFIQEDKIKDAKTKEDFEKRKDRIAYNIHIQSDDGVIKFSQVFMYSTRKNSNWYNLIKKYGTIKVGTEIEWYVNENGFYRIKLAQP
jgi:hypothetical protein